MAPVAFETIKRIVALTSAISDCIVGLIVIQVFDCPLLGDFYIVFASVWSVASFDKSGGRLGNFCPD